MSLWEQMKPMMDAQVDNGLGNSISYTPEGEQARVVQGFIIMYGDPGGMDGIDPANIRWYAKIKKDLLPHRPRKGDRLTAAPLRNRPYQPQASQHDEGGDYWIFDIAKV